MKKYFLFLTIAAFAFTGCDEDNLDIPQKGVASVETFYRTDYDAEAALVVVYNDTQHNFVVTEGINNYQPYFGLTNFQADDIFLAGSGPDDCVPEREFHDFRYGVSNVVVLWGYTVLYRSIHKCNLVINNFTEDRLGSLSPVMKRCVAEARVMRAFDHLMLGIYWGTPPIVEEVLKASSSPVNAESQEAVMTWVAKEIDLALPDLDERKSINDKEGAVKITKGFANAIKGKALIWKGDYEGAKKALKEVINSNKYQLVNDISKIYHRDGDYSSESVFEFNCVNVQGTVENIANLSGDNPVLCYNWRWDDMYSPSENDPKLNNKGWGWLTPTGDFCRKLIDNDGMDSPRRKAWIKTYDEVLYDFWWPGDGDSFTPGKTEAKEKDKNRGIKKVFHGNEGYFLWKTIAHKDQDDLAPYCVHWSGRAWNKNFSIMRYAEVLLLYAEACAQTGDNDGLRYLQAIQNRAGSNHVSTELTLAEVQNEKQFELWLEGTRSADLIRWKKYDAFANVDHNVKSLSDALTIGTGDKHTTDVIDDPNGTDCYSKLSPAPKFDQNKHTLLPFPLDVIRLNSGIKQNPGW